MSGDDAIDARWRELGLLSSDEEDDESAEGGDNDADSSENELMSSPTQTAAAAAAPHVPNLGYRPPAGVVYAQPREPFVRTYWDGAENMFRRNDPQDGAVLLGHGRAQVQEEARRHRAGGGTVVAIARRRS